MSWASFQERISLAPKQILSCTLALLWQSYYGPYLVVGHETLIFPSVTTVVANDVWNFRILPQLLYFFHVQDHEDSLDWATIVVYTCEASCEGPMGYKEEFGWVQLAYQSISAPITTTA
ncbi:hypothetical protein CASFOL_008920 [Castilleja foliolosa]|uniref:Programmed cell death protein 2 C-terminal domain-containing protein n=1 Tax=Castilleja foliolosa TaxID=1961234 RepID=A0ABD3E0V7_9LAMI